MAFDNVDQNPHGLWNGRNGNETSVNEEDIDPTLRNPLEAHDSNTAFALPRQQAGYNYSQWYYFLCGYCGSRGPRFCDGMITFEQQGLRKDEDLILCHMCWNLKFVGLDKWRIRPIFNANSGQEPHAMIRVLSLRSLHDTEPNRWQEVVSRSDPKEVCRRWLPPSLPFVWPLWSVEPKPRKARRSSKLLVVEGANRALDEPTSRPRSKSISEPSEGPFECELTGERFSKASKFIEHIAGYLGRYRSSICTEEEIEEYSRTSSTKRLPRNLFARFDSAKSHITDTVQFKKYHGPIPEDGLGCEGRIEENCPDDVLRRGILNGLTYHYEKETWKKHINESNSEALRKRGPLVEEVLLGKSTPIIKACAIPDGQIAPYEINPPLQQSSDENLPNYS
ncbi:hypothetical protein TWF730_009002 [Orbilia blumenaviensis]|uniref:C2H2-type domain-containing protein n=1 Tax=Orbilia blumenaviensis TaxID=1796055 RepID=A0AAV9UXZ2_9PEZI